MKHMYHIFWENSTSNLTALRWIQEIFTRLLAFTSKIIYFQLNFFTFGTIYQQDYHPKIEIISEMTNDSNSALEEDNTSMLENSVGEEVPTAIFSSVYKIRKEHEKENLRPLVESLFTEPATSERYPETKDNQGTPLKPLIQEVITEPRDNLLLSPVCNQPDDPIPWEEDGKITVTFPGKITVTY